MHQDFPAPLSAIHDYALRHQLSVVPDYSEIFVPGRVEILGKHTDYAGGSSLTAALSRGLHFVYTPRQDDTVVVHAVDFDEQVNITPGESVAPADGHWSAYTQQVVRRIFNNFHSVNHGAEIFVTSTLPIASGMSSSSAFVVGTFICLGKVNNVALDADYKNSIKTVYDLADYLSTVENGGNYKTLEGHTGVGTLGGSEDHTAILASREATLGLYRYRPTTPVDFVKWPESLSLVVLSSGVTAEKSGSARDAYNRASRLAAEVVSLWNGQAGTGYRHLGEIVKSGGFDPEAMRAFFAQKSEALANRFDHFYLEETRFIPGAVASLKEGDIDRFAGYINASAEAVDRLLGNQVDETRYLMKSANRLGALCASPFGAGFGGSVYAIASAEIAADLAHDWLNDYLKHFPQNEKATAFVDRPQEGVHF